MAFDFKKEHKELYVPPMNYLAVRGHGDPNAEGGAYKRAIELL